MRSAHVRVNLDLNQSLYLGVRIPYRHDNVWVEFKFERLPNFCFHYGKLSHYVHSCVESKKLCMNFGRKYAMFGDWIRAGMNEPSSS